MYTKVYIRVSIKDTRQPPLEGAPSFMDTLMYTFVYKKNYPKYKYSKVVSNFMIKISELWVN